MYEMKMASSKAMPKLHSVQISLVVLCDCSSLHRLELLSLQISHLIACPLFPLFVVYVVALFVSFVTLLFGSVICDRSFCYVVTLTCDRSSCIVCCSFLCKSLMVRSIVMSITSFHIEVGLGMFLKLANSPYHHCAS